MTQECMPWQYLYWAILELILASTAFASSGRSLVLRYIDFSELRQLTVMFQIVFTHTRDSNVSVEQTPLVMEEQSA